MRFLLEAALSNAVVASLLALAVVAICRFPLRPAARHALWLIVLVKFVTPPLFPLVLPESQEWLAAWKTDQSSGPSHAPDRSTDTFVETQFYELYSQLRSPMSEPAAFEGDHYPDESGDAPVSSNASSPLIPKPAGALNTTPAHAVHESPELVTETGLTNPQTARVASATPQDSSTFTLVDLIGPIWIGGSLAWFIFAGLRLRAFHRQVVWLLPADDTLQNLANEVAAELGLKRPPLLRMTDAVVPPMLTLVPNRAVIILPARLMSTLSRSQQSAILDHELAHFRRGDQWMRWFEFVVVGLYWWHPVVWFARKQLQAAEELCCDAWVVRVYPDQARGYAHALLAAVDFLAEVRAPAPAEACTLGPLSSLKQRLDMILQRKQFPELSPAAKLTLVALAFFILPWAPQLFGQAPESPPAGVAPVAVAPASVPTAAPSAQPGAQNAPVTEVPPAIPVTGAAPAPPPTAAPIVQELPLTPPVVPQVPGGAPPTVPVAPPAKTIPSMSPGPGATLWPVPANYGPRGQSAPTPDSGPQAKSIEERLDRLEKMIEQFVSRGAAPPAAGLGGPPPSVPTPVGVPVLRQAPHLKSLFTRSETLLEATERRIQELEQELAALKRRKDVFSNTDPNGVSIVVDTVQKAIRALNMNGTTLWAFSIENPESVHSASSNGQVVTVKTNDGQTFQLDSKTGRMILGSLPPTPAAPQPALPKGPQQ